MSSSPMQAGGIVLRKSWALLRRRPAWLLFPLVTLLLVLVGSTGLWVGTVRAGVHVGAWHANAAGGSHWSLNANAGVALVLANLLLVVILLRWGAVGLLACVNAELEGERLSVPRGLLQACRRLPLIIVLSLLRPMLWVPGPAAGHSYSPRKLLTEAVFSMPLLAQPGARPRRIWERSQQVFVACWGAAATPTNAILWLTFALLIPAAVLSMLCLMITQGGAYWPAGVRTLAWVGVAFWSSVCVVASVSGTLLNQLWALVCYRYASAGLVSAPFTARDFDAAHADARPHED